MDKTFTIALVVLVSVIILLLVIIRNKKDRKDLERKLNQDYRKKKTDEEDAE